MTEVEIEREIERRVRKRIDEIIELLHLSSTQIGNKPASGFLRNLADSFRRYLNESEQEKIIKLDEMIGRGK